LNSLKYIFRKIKNNISKYVKSIWCKIIEKKYNIEKYIANLRIKVKKFIARDLNEALLFKIKLLENKKIEKYMILLKIKIYYIYISLEENIDDLLCGKITKE